jgi:hypothetical protein
MIPTLPEILETKSSPGSQARIVGGDPLSVPAFLYTSIEGGQMRATLQPKRKWCSGSDLTKGLK